MRIAQVAPLFESVPPKLYGGTERVVSYLTEELVRQGHDVTLFASGDSKTGAKLVSPCPRALRLDKGSVDPLAMHFLLMEWVFKEAAHFDLLHFHIDYLHYPLSRRMRLPQLTTLHGRLDIPELPALYREFSEMPVVSISDAQRRPLPEARWISTVHHGLPENLYRPYPGPGEYLAFMGRFSPEKRPEVAIEIARRAGMPLKIAAKLDKKDRDYFAEIVEPVLSDPLVDYVGEIGEHQKNDFLGRAAALLFPIDWPEPFGLVMIEAMACGTPVIALDRGSVSEVLEEAVSGFIIRNTDQAVEAARRARHLDRKRCREAFERRFTAARMARDYTALYERLLEERPALPEEAA